MNKEASVELAKRMARNDFVSNAKLTLCKYSTERFKKMSKCLRPRHYCYLCPIYKKHNKICRVEGLRFFNYQIPKAILKRLILWL